MYSTDLQTACQSYLTFLQSKAPGVSLDDIRRYLCACALRVWGGNELYSPAYADALRVISGKAYSHEQVMTAMACCSDAERPLLPPPFFARMVASDAESAAGGAANPTDVSREAIEKLAELLVCAALVNGDFTLAEANAVARVVDALSEMCDAGGVPARASTLHLHDRVTPLRADSYWRRREDAAAKPTAKQVASPPPAETAPAPAPANLTLNLYLGAAESAETAADPAKEGAEAAAPAAARASVSPADTPTLEAALAELDSLVGLAGVKKDVHSLFNFIRICRLREARGFSVPTLSYHLAFTGNPGTGKTTVARLVAQLYYRMGLLAQGQLIETDRSALVAGYLGQTAIKVQKVVQQAIGGVLFIDEAYSLANDDDDSYGKEAIETLLKAMEDHRDEMVVIVAGYDDLMRGFIDSNPGLRSRFNKYFHFPDYTGDEMTQIFHRFCDKNGYRVEDGASDDLLARFDALYANRQAHFGNARTVRNLFEKAINRQADRLSSLKELSDDDLRTLCAADIAGAFEGVSA